MQIKRALLSVSNKSGLIDFARGLIEQGVELISTGGTAKALAAEGIPVCEISDFTGFPEMMDGRVKTLHPKIHGGLLYRRDNPEHLAQAKAHDILPIDLVCVNLYPFAETIAKKETTLEQAIEQIDIGGPSMIRSASKNYHAVTVVVDPDDYPRILDAMSAGNGSTTPELRARLAVKAFSTTAAYDHAISAYLDGEIVPGSSLSLDLPQVCRLRYGENPHQEAELYGNFFDYFEKLHGKELSFNNILDITAATRLISEFDKPTVAILKHTNPCGVGSDSDLCAAWEKAFATDRSAPFGGIIIVNRPVDEAFAKAISEIFSEVIIAPEFSAEARAILQKKKNLRLMRLIQPIPSTTRDIRSVIGGLLVQDADIDDSNKIGEMERHVVTSRPPTRDELEAMEFGWKVVKHVKSNAIVYVSRDRTLGIGAGQMSRVDASRIAVWKAAEAGLSLKGSVVCSDAFFPFADGLIAAAEAQASAAIQPGGSIRDEEVIAAANERGMAMVFTGMRHFRH
ncbi:MAG: bifunctional phosphoribosylaminoimidazolecarboxamide formyltransferase/IMP cyclohydrolase [Verrucomicrobia bacterium RIFCSPHIGHO2_12_FULL_41_10]|nr:MAG: bifunctional phosphoribosylaminoimidazolecarboxamide formyltransferase/IMP cyclohydrolase [Verrucomicrobia bacterium RIFCSPHIGHO2_12_FULL_41_10]HLB33520.1 bifunctional phosphoribosylaminoimidazolecarboxamide formyltransferase/IMP cyclohydrolase [Chthoniobacterales bacterium]